MCFWYFIYHATNCVFSHLFCMCYFIYHYCISPDFSVVFVLYITFIFIFNLFSGPYQLSFNNLITFCGLIVSCLKDSIFFLCFLTLFLKKSMFPLTTLKLWTMAHVNSASVFLGDSVLLQICGVCFSSTICLCAPFLISCFGSIYA